MVTNKKSILLVANGNHQFITNYTKWLSKQQENKFQVDILSLTPIKEINKKYYNRTFNINKNIFINLVYKIEGNRRYYRLYQYKKVFKSLPYYDIIHFHFISVDSYFLVRHVKKYTKSKIILSIWGSDMYRIKPENEDMFFQTCKKADHITFTNQKAIEFFQSKYHWQKNNLRLCRFGLAPLENLKELKATRTEYKIQLNWKLEKLAITIGYNLSRFQQHLEILQQFEDKAIIALKDKIQLVLPMTYGGVPEYKKQLLARLNDLPFKYFVYDTFLSDEKVAQIRKASDIMIQLQETDQFSGSMQEYLFACNVVVTGSWLPYKTIKDHGARFIEIDKINELVHVLPNIINNYKKYEIQTENNSKAILELSSWEKNIKDWIVLYTA